MRRPGAERADEHRGRDRQGQRGRQAGHDARTRRSRPAAPSWPRSRRNRRTRPACAATWSRSTRAALYHLYRFKKYTDVRLVFAPEQQIAFFGGDPGQLRVSALRPRHVLLPRLRERQAGSRSKHYLKWSKAGATDDELVFVSGHPGQHRPADHGGRAGVSARHRLIRSCCSGSIAGKCCCRRSAAAARKTPGRPRSSSSACRTAARRAIGGLAGLLDPELMARKKEHEKKLRDAVARERRSSRTPHGAGTRSPRPRRSAPRTSASTPCSKAGAGFNSELFGYRPHAGAGRRGTAQAQRRTAARIRRLRTRIAEAAAVFRRAASITDYEIVKLADSPDLPVRASSATTIRWCRRCWPASRRRSGPTELVSGTKLIDVEVRKKLYEGGKKAVDASKDPMIVLAKLVDPEARDGPQDHRDEVEEVEAAGLRRDRQGQVRPGRDQHLSRRHVHAAAGVRPVKGYEEDGKHDPVRDHVRRPVRAVEGAQRQAALRPAEALDRAQGQART